MADVELRWLTEEALKISFNSDSMEDLVITKSSMERQTGSEAQKLLAASAAECMGSTFLFLLKWAKINFEDFRVTADVITEKDEEGSISIGSINLGLWVDVPKDEETMKRLRRVENLISRGCFIGRSLEKGIKVNYSIST